MSAMMSKGMTEKGAVAAKPFADLDAKWAGAEQHSVNFIQNAYNSFRRS
jgi:cyclase